MHILYKVPYKVRKCDETFKGTVSRDFLLQVFFHESSSPKLQKITVGFFRIFSKIRAVIFISEGAPPISTTPVANLPLLSTTTVDSGALGKLIHKKPKVENLVALSLKFFFISCNLNYVFLHAVILHLS